MQINTRLEFIDVFVDVLVHGNAKVVVNCSGIGARKLVGDKLVSPLRGQVSTLRTIFENLRSPEFSAVVEQYFSKILQVMRVAAPWLRKVVLDDRDDGNYVIPNLDSVVVGGTHQDGDWDRVGCHDSICSYFCSCLQTPRSEDKDFILAGGTAIEPSLRGATHIKDWVGEIVYSWVTANAEKAVDSSDQVVE